MATRSTYRVAGMTCGHCVSSVRAAVSAVEGVNEVEVDLATGELVVISETRVDADAVRSAVDAAGYEVVT